VGILRQLNIHVLDMDGQNIGSLQFPAIQFTESSCKLLAIFPTTDCGDGRSIRDRSFTFVLHANESRLGEENGVKGCVTVHSSHKVKFQKKWQLSQSRKLQ
jgi:hypothetical protein